MADVVPVVRSWSAQWSRWSFGLLKCCRRRRFWSGTVVVVCVCLRFSPSCGWAGAVAFRSQSRLFSARYGRGDATFCLGDAGGAVAAVGGGVHPEAATVPRAAAVPRRSGSSIPADPRELVVRARSCLGVRVASGRDVARGALADVAFRLPLAFGEGCGGGSVFLVEVVHRCISRTCRCVRQTQSGQLRCVKLLAEPLGSS